MAHLIVGIITVLIGALLTFRGYPAIRLVIGLLGALAGFAIGTAVVAALGGGALLDGALGWVGGVVGALICGTLAYLIYQIAVVVGIGAIGFTLGTALAGLLGVSSGVVATAVGVGVAAILVIAALATDVPSAVIVVLTALAGADLLVLGVRIIAGDVAIAQTATVTVAWVDTSPLWWVTTAVVALGGVVAQWRYLKSNRNRSTREQWSGPGPVQPR